MKQFTTIEIRTTPVFRDLLAYIPIVEPRVKELVVEVFNFIMVHGFDLDYTERQYLEQLEYISNVLKESIPNSILDEMRHISIAKLFFQSVLDLNEYLLSYDKHSYFNLRYNMVVLLDVNFETMTFKIEKLQEAI